MARTTSKKNQFEIPTLDEDPRTRARQLTALIDTAKTGLAQAVVEARTNGATLGELRDDTGVWGETLKRLVRAEGMTWPDDAVAETVPAKRSTPKAAPKSPAKASGRTKTSKTVKSTKPAAKTVAKKSGRKSKVAA